MQEVSKDIFYQTIQNWEDVPFSQSDGFVRLQCADNASCVRYFLDEQIGCAAYVKRFMGLTMLMVDTECLQHRHTKPTAICRFYEALRQTGVDMIEVNSRRIYQADYEIGIRQAGFLRPVGSFSFQLTNMIDLTQPIRFNENWKRNLKQSDGLGFVLELIEQPDSQDIADFMDLYKQMCAQKRLSLPFTENLLCILLNDPHFHLSFLCEGSKRLAAIIYHQTNTHCGLLYAATGSDGSEKRAGFQLYKLLLTRLQAEGMTSFDMEKLAPSIHSMNAVFLFKQGIRGELMPLCGEWSWYKRRWYGIGMYFVKKYIWKKVQA
jgi:hypothetical protein